MLGRLRRARRVAEERFASARGRATPSLAHDVVVALIRPDKRKLWHPVDPVVSAALLVELVQEGRLVVSGTGRKVRVDVRDRAPLGDSELDDALATVIAGLLGTKVGPSST